MGIDYIPTEEERRVFRDCNHESFWYRSVPISVISMALTQFLISRRALTASGRFGSLPKVAFAGVCGYLGGKMSYMKTCTEKFKRLENSALGEALRQREQHRLPMLPREQPELSDPDKTQSFSYEKDVTYSDSMTSAFDIQLSEPSHVEEDVQKKPILYEELRTRNRENYDITVTQKAGVPLKHPADVAPSKKGKKNIYGDTWEE
ncbi:OCIA domain-containing protein 1-like isoform X2 [Triplophysa rosa]|uniref:OCIA domain-containing protein 1 n=2 Tax=Triplophysa rosa TaxID=992332 RepID=A0A9W7WYJ6_TRIRA|nr:OCIA domain-containing protein 1-like isoform X2 [Triplophysa rosa]KAI7811082.1 putative OCIA domain-containing protein 1 [Triplophysa rosa]